MDMYGKNDFSDTSNNVQLLVCCKTLSNEISSDFSLPDYCPEIRKLLRVSAKPLPADSYVSGASADFSGDIEYTLIYVGDDNAIYSECFSDKYEFSVPLENDCPLDLNEGLYAFADSTPELSVGRVTSPRKLNVKTRLRSKICVYGKCNIGEQMNGEYALSSIQRLHKSCNASCIVREKSELSSLYDEFTPANFSQESRIICTDARVFITDANAGNKSIACSGNVILNFLLCRDGESGITSLERKIPFSYSLESESVTPECICRAFGCCKNPITKIEEDKITCSVDVILEAEALKDCEISYTSDIYSTEKKVNVSCQNYKIPKLLSCANGNFTNSASFPISNSTLAAASNIIDVFATASATEVTYENNRFFVEGECHYNVIADNGGEYVYGEFSSPFKYETDGEKGSASDYSVDVEVIAGRVKLDGENLNIDSELAVASRIGDFFEVSSVCSASFGEVHESAKKGVVICYPSKNESVWEIAKRYHVNFEKLASENGISANALPISDVDYLII
jgi:hypothetical protein